MHRELATLGTFFLDHHQSMVHKCPEMVMAQGMSSDLTELVDKAECLHRASIVCLHQAEDELLEAARRTQ